MQTTYCRDSTCRLLHCISFIRISLLCPPLITPVLLLILLYIRNLNFCGIMISRWSSVTFERKLFQHHTYFAVISQILSIFVLRFISEYLFRTQSHAASSTVREMLHETNLFAHLFFFCSFPFSIFVLVKLEYKFRAQS